MRRNLARGLLMAASGLAVLALAAACGDDDDDDDGGGGDGGTASTVAVNLKEYEVLPDKDSVPAGSITFRATNTGPADPHELVVMKTDLAPGALPTADDGSVDEEGQGVELIGEIEDLAVDATEEATFTLGAGKYVLLCNIVEQEDGETESHYQQGMRAAFTVE